MIPTVSYDYASGDLLENRNTYFYTKFQGSQFLLAWRQQRDMALVEKGVACFSGKRSDTAPVEHLLETIRRDLSGKNSNIIALQQLSHLLQRFEVTKRLHGEYSTNWRPTDPQDYHGLESYVRFAEVLDLAYASTSALPYLNALLKCMDTLTALRERLDSSQNDRVRELIVCERAHVEQLLQRVGKPVELTLKAK